MKEQMIRQIPIVEKISDGLLTNSFLTIVFPVIDPCPIKNSPPIKENIPNNKVECVDFKKLFFTILYYKENCD